MYFYRILQILSNLQFITNSNFKIGSIGGDPGNGK